MAIQAPVASAWPRPTQAFNEPLPVFRRIRQGSFRNWPAVLFLVLTGTPVVALVVLGNTPSAATFDHVAWIFAAYFAIAWLLLLAVIVRPEHVSKPMLALVTVIALASQVPLAIALETALNARTGSLAASIFTVGVPEELAKAIPVMAIVLLYWRRRSMQPRDYLFLGAVSGLTFGASEVVHYFTVNVVAEFYQTVQQSLPSIGQQVANGNSPSASVFDVLIGPVRYFVIDFVWRFLTDPISHALWAGLTGYFIGLAVTRRHKWFLVCWIGLAAAAVLHGLNDWGRVNGGPLWVVVTVISAILFLGCAKIGSRGDRQDSADALPAMQPPGTGNGAARGSADGDPTPTTTQHPSRSQPQSAR
jgi:RsiW-degrading membrane proteinase PrsW (M82 family)